MSDRNQNQEELNSPVATENGAHMANLESETTRLSEADSSELAASESVASEPVASESAVSDPHLYQQRTMHNAAPRPFKPRQFLFGLALSAGGVGLMLFVAAGALHDVGAGGAISLPATGLCMILGLMMLGGGFGQMAISSPRFDDTEFQRMLNGEMPDDDDDEGAGSVSYSAGTKSSNGLLDDSNSPEVVSDESVSSDHDQLSADDSASKKRGREETNDNFVSTVLSDVVASHG